MSACMVYRYVNRYVRKYASMEVNRYGYTYICKKGKNVKDIKI